MEKVSDILKLRRQCQRLTLTHGRARATNSKKFGEKVGRAIQFKAVILRN